MNHPVFRDPEGGAQEVRRFSTRQDDASKNPGHVADGRFASVLRVFFGSWIQPIDATVCRYRSAGVS
ncbi:hypothetical protein QUA41_31455, partial [Microcoleus sp. Pol11C1]|uniref:hypothetical protein n=1 Tax=Microcoleus sp. Pol11C1 TaxID=3055388 RepID=UPI002FCE81B4